MAAEQKMKLDRPPPVVYDLRVMPALNRGASEIRRRIEQYVEYMRKGGRTPRQIHVDAGQFETLRRAINSQLHDTAPLVAGLQFDGLPIVVLGAKGVDHAA